MDDWGATTDADGRFRMLVHPEVSLRLIVTVTGDGGETARIEVPRLDGAEVTIRLDAK